MKALNLITTIKTFIEQHEAAITDLAFIAGYLLILIAVTMLILFFGLRYVRKHQKSDEKMIKGYTRRSLLDMFDCFVSSFIFYAAFVFGVKVGLCEENQILFKVMPPFIFSLSFFPIAFLVFFAFIFMSDKLNSKNLHCKKKGDIDDDIKSPSVPDIADSDTSVGSHDCRIHHD